MNLQEIYNEKCQEISDINEHLPVLKQYTEECSHATEFGVRGVVSTYALMMGKPKILKSYDITPIEDHGVSRNDLVSLAKENGVEFEFIVGNTLQIEIDETDLLFIDTWHTYDQLKKELELHADKVKKYLIFHDTTTFGQVGEHHPIGLWPAIEEFLISNNNWVIEKKLENNNGLTILKNNKWKN
jgi:hypothetical protein